MKLKKLNNMEKIMLAYSFLDRANIKNCPIEGVKEELETAHEALEHAILTLTASWSLDKQNIIVK